MGPDEYNPAEDVLTRITAPVLLLVKVTLAPATTASEGSFTTPTMLPVPTVDCAGRKGEANKRITTAIMPIRAARTHGAIRSNIVNLGFAIFTNPLSHSFSVFQQLRVVGKSALRRGRRLPFNSTPRQYRVIRIFQADDLRNQNHSLRFLGNLGEYQ